MGVAALADDQHHEGDDHQHHAEGLGHPDGLTKQGPVKQVQAVGAHPLDPGPADAVPDEVEAGVLPVEGPGLGDDEDDEEQTDEIPQALVEEGGMDLDVLRGGGPQPHPPGQVGLPAEGLAVDEIPPTPYSLSDEQAHASQVREGPEGQLLDLAEDHQHEKGHDHRPVDGQSPVPDPQHGHPVQSAVGPPVQVQIEDDVVDPGADDAQGQLPDDQVVDVVLGEAVSLGLAAAEQHRQQQARHNDDAVPVDPVSPVDGHRVRVELPVPEETGKADGHIASRLHGNCPPSGV